MTRPCCSTVLFVPCAWAPGNLCDEETVRCCSAKDTACCIEVPAQSSSRALDVAVKRQVDLRGPVQAPYFTRFGTSNGFSALNWMPLPYSAAVMLCNALQ